jgi:hypothetical protein
MVDLVAGTALWLGNASHDLSRVLATARPGDLAAGTTGCWITHF